MDVLTTEYLRDRLEKQGYSPNREKLQAIFRSITDNLSDTDYAIDDVWILYNHKTEKREQVNIRVAVRNWFDEPSEEFAETIMEVKLLEISTVK